MRTAMLEDDEVENLTEVVKPRPRRDKVGADRHVKTWTFERWAAANGYDPKTRTYAETEAPLAAIPGAHCGTHRNS